MSKPLYPKTTRAEELRQAAIKKKKDNARDAEKLSFGHNKPKKTKVVPTTSNTSDPFQSTSSSFTDSPESRAHKTFSAPPAENITSFIHAFDDQEGLLEDLQPLNSLKSSYSSMNSTDIVSKVASEIPATSHLQKSDSNIATVDKEQQSQPEKPASIQLDSVPSAHDSTTAGDMSFSSENSGNGISSPLGTEQQKLCTGALAETSPPVESGNGVENELVSNVFASDKQEELVGNIHNSEKQELFGSAPQTESSPQKQSGNGGTSEVFNSTPVSDKQELFGSVPPSESAEGDGNELFGSVPVSDKQELFGSAPVSGKQELFGISPPGEPDNGGGSELFGSTRESDKQKELYGCASPAGSDKGGDTELFGSVPPSESDKGGDTELFGSVPPSESDSGGGSEAFDSTPVTDRQEDLFTSTPVSDKQELFGSPPESEKEDTDSAPSSDRKVLFDSAPESDKQEELFGIAPPAESDKGGNSELFGSTPESDNQELFGNAPPAESDNGGDSELFDSTPESDKQELFGSAPVSDKQELFGNTPVSDKQELFGSAPVSDKQELFGSAPVSDKPELFSDAPPAEPDKGNGSELFGSPPESDKQELFGNAPVSDKQELFGDAPPAESVSGRGSELFGSAPASDKQELFGSAPVSDKQELFGSTPESDKQELFGNAPPADSVSGRGSELFGSTPESGKQELFGSTPVSDKQEELFDSTPESDKQELIGNAPPADSVSGCGSELFGNAPESDKHELFGCTPVSDKQEELFDSTPESGRQDQLFGNAPPAESVSGCGSELFGSTPESDKQELFGSAPVSDKQELFGNAPPADSVSGGGSELFGSAPESGKQDQLFGSTPPAESEKVDGNELFGNAPVTERQNSFGSTGPGVKSPCNPPERIKSFNDASNLFGGNSVGFDGVASVAPSVQEKSDRSSSGAHFDVASPQSAVRNSSFNDASSLFGGDNSTGLPELPPAPAAPSPSAQKQKTRVAIVSDASSLFGSDSGGFGASSFGGADPFGSHPAQAPSAPLRNAESKHGGMADAASLFGSGPVNDVPFGSTAPQPSQGVVENTVPSPNTFSHSSPKGDDKPDVIGKLSQNDGCTGSETISRNSSEPSIPKMPAPTVRSVSHPTSVPDNLFSTADSLFSSGPQSSGLFGSSSSAGADLFCSPPPGSSSGFPKGKTAVDVFDRPAPEVVQSNPSAPPSAPGVRTVPKPTTPVPRMNTPTGKSAPSHTVKSAPRSSTGGTSVAPPPADHIPTPHGYVPANQKPAPEPARSEEKKANVTIPPAKSKVKKTHGAHFHHQSPMPSVPLPADKSADQSADNVIKSYHCSRGPYKPAPGPVVSFGFGGRIVVMQPGLQASDVTNPFHAPPSGAQSRPCRPGPVKIYKMIDIVKAHCTRVSVKGNALSPDAAHHSETAQLVELATGFTGPLGLPTGKLSQKRNDIVDFVKSRIENPFSAVGRNLGVRTHSFAESERLLWELLLILMEFKGSAMSDLSNSAASGTHSPEFKIVELLLGEKAKIDPSGENDAIILQQFMNHIAAQQSRSAANDETRQAELAKTYARIESLLLSGRRSEAVDVATDAEDWPLAIIISSVCGKSTYQAVIRAYADKHFPKQSGLNLLSLIYSNQAEGTLKHGGKAFVASSPSQGPSGQDTSSLWKRNLSAVLSNKVGDWSQLVRHIGDRILQESGDVMAAHVAYLSGGSLYGRGKISLIGFAEETSSGAANKPPSSASKKSALDVRCMLAIRMTEIFEWCLMSGVESGSGSENSASTGAALSSMFGLGSSDKNSGNTAAAAAGDAKSSLLKVSQETLLKCRIAFCPYKVRLAIALADMGLTESAIGYAMEAKSLVQLSASSAGEGKQSKGRPPPSGSKQSDQSGGAKPSPGFSKGFVHMLDELIDRLSGGRGGDGVVSIQKASAAAESSNQDGASTSGWKNVWSIFSSPNLKDLVDGSASGQQDRPSDRGSTLLEKPPSTVQQAPPLGVSHYSPPVSGAGSMAPPPQGSLGGNTVGGLKSSNSTGNLDSPGFLDGKPPLSTNEGGMSQFGSQPADHRSAPESAPAQLSHKRQSSLDSNTTKKSATGGSPSGKKSDPEGKNVLTNVRKGLLSWLYPDAHDTTENMGQGLDAVYDKATGKWIFPEDENNPDANKNPADAPPPIMAPAPAAPAPPSGAPDSSDSGGGYDPLAALMAPPSRTYGAPAAATSNSDPLASLMAPPPVRIPAQPAPSSGGNRPPAQAPPKVWTPPVPTPSPQGTSTSGGAPPAEGGPPNTSPAGGHGMPPPPGQHSPFPPPPM